MIHSVSYRNLNTILFLLLSTSVMAQHYLPDYSKQRSFACIVVDAQTDEPLPMATLRVGRLGWSADKSGQIEAFANVGDTLVFTHVGYLPAVLEVKESLFAQNIVAVKLSPDNIFLSEVVVKPRRLTLSQEAKMVAEELAVPENMATDVFSDAVCQAFSYSPSYDMDVFDNQKYALGLQSERVTHSGMVAPHQMFGISSNSILHIVNRNRHRKMHSNTNAMRNGIKPLTAEEMLLLMQQK